jgi:hypothetical protein
MKISKAVGSVGGGIVATLVTGLINTTPEGLVGGVWYGWPTSWLVRRVLAPQYFPWFPNYTNFVLDVIFFAAVIYAILVISRLGDTR